MEDSKIEMVNESVVDMKPGEVFVASLGELRSDDRFTLTCDKRLKDEFKALCASKAITPTKILNQWMQAYIAMYKK